jgi:predicted DNA-binding transcriptional regulator AlpA
VTVTRQPEAVVNHRKGGRVVGDLELLPLEAVYRALDVARSTFYEWRRKGTAPRCIKLPNGDLRIRRSELERWLRACEVAD